MIISKPKILCVDDEPDLLDINSTILRSAGYEVFKASTGSECLRIAGEQKPDLILLDVILPDMNGIDISKQIKTGPEFKGTYVILISGQRTSSDSKVEGLEAGADGYIVRPVSKHELLARVQAIMRIKETETVLRKKEKELKRLNEELELRVVERTFELETANKALQVEITERRQVEEKLKRYAEHLQALSKRLLEIQEAERRYIAQELHDEIGQDLTGIKLALEAIIEFPSDNREKRLFEMQKMVHELLGKVKDISLDLRPSMLDDLGLLPALLWHFERYTQKTNIKVHFTHSGLNVRFQPEIETASYRIVQEALTNIARYAHVNEAAVIIKASQEMLVINIEDKGAGFDHEVIKASGNTAGLRWMHERIAMLGGKILVESTQGKGTRLIAEIPLRRTTP